MLSLSRIAPLAASLLLACGDKDQEHDDSGHEHSDETETEAVTVRFEATVGEEAFSCSTQHTGVGATGATLEAFDNRLYVHELTLLDADGGEHPVTLTDDGMWQVQNVALLDFEDKSGACANGTAEMNGVLIGTVAAHDTVAVRFTLGLPFELNHQDPATAPSPLNLSAFFWTWESGYKFWRFDGRTTAAPEGFFFHLGSTGCETDTDGAVTSCSRPTASRSPSTASTRRRTSCASTSARSPPGWTSTAQTPPACRGRGWATARRGSAPWVCPGETNKAIPPPRPCSP
ncbi:MAG: metallo-mystery pair system four-Cys motif protein [Deltaproteobacteria bacterium]|nr:metallo-mystery pair system four-Cys motif protein [Deltaproteobacteria bacterium]